MGWVKVTSRGEGSGEVVDDTRLSDTQRVIVNDTSISWRKSYWWLGCEYRLLKNLCGSVIEECGEGDGVDSEK